MKKLVLLALVVIALASCGKEKKVDTPIVETKKEVIKEEVKKEVVKEVATNDNAAKGKEIFTAKGCVACHQLDKKVIGPSLQDIAKIYTEKKGNMVKFLKGNSDAIVDTDPAQVAIMKANITGILKGMSAEDLQAITAYIRSTVK